MYVCNISLFPSPLRPAEANRHKVKMVKILSPDVEDDEITVGPALFGPDLGTNEFQVCIN